MQLDLSGHHVEVTDSLRAYVIKKFERISRHFEQLIDVHCVLTVEKFGHTRRAPLAPGEQELRMPRPKNQVCLHIRPGRQARSLRQEAQGKGRGPPRRGRDQGPFVGLTSGARLSMRLIIVSGLSGSGKSVALHMLEDI